MTGASFIASGRVPRTTATTFRPESWHESRLWTGIEFNSFAGAVIKLDTDERPDSNRNLSEVQACGFCYFNSNNPTCEFVCLRFGNAVRLELNGKRRHSIGEKQCMQR